MAQFLQQIKAKGERTGMSESGEQCVEVVGIHTCESGANMVSVSIHFQAYAFNLY